MRTTIDTQPNAAQGNKLPKLTALVAAGALMLGACGSDNDNEPALSVGEQIVTEQGLVNPELCAERFAEDDDVFTYRLNDGKVVEAGSTEDFDTTVERSYVPQSIASFLPVDYAKAFNGVDGFRAWGSAVETPLTGSNLSESSQSVFEKICTNPLYKENIIAGFSRIIDPSTGNKLGDNPTNAYFMQGHTVANANDNAEDAYWNFKNFDQTSQTPSTLSIAETVERMNEHELSAAAIITMIETHFSPDRFEENAVTMYHIGLAEAEVPENGFLPELSDELPQYEGNFMVYKYTNKEGRCIEVAINLGDGKFTELVDGVCIQQGDITTTTVKNTVPPTGSTPPTGTQPPVHTTPPDSTVPGRKTPTVPLDATENTTLQNDEVGNPDIEDTGVQDNAPVGESDVTPTGEDAPTIVDATPSGPNSDVTGVDTNGDGENDTAVVINPDDGQDDNVAQPGGDENGDGEVNNADVEEIIEEAEEVEDPRENDGTDDGTNGSINNGDR